MATSSNQTKYIVDAVSELVKFVVTIGLLSLIALRVPGQVTTFIGIAAFVLGGLKIPIKLGT